jgi:hypothetical protein
MEHIAEAINQAVAANGQTSPQASVDDSGTMLLAFDTPNAGKPFTVHVTAAEIEE